MHFIQKARETNKRECNNSPGRWIQLQQDYTTKQKVYNLTPHRVPLKIIKSAKMETDEDMET